MKPRTLAITILAAVALSGCGSKPHAIVAPPPPPPAILSVAPPAQSLHVVEDAGISAHFSVALDPATVNTRTVFLKIDYTRIPIDVVYSAADTTVRIVPHSLLNAGQTYTVEITPAVHSLNGAFLTESYLWQFTTRGVTRPRSPLPVSGTVDESPFVTLSWDSTDTSAGDIRYDVYAGTDSTQVAARTATRLGTFLRPLLLPRASWGNGTRLFWSITVRNLTTNDTVDGPVWNLTTVPANAPVDSVTVLLAAAGYLDPRATPSLTCNTGIFASSPTRTCVIQWALDPLPPDLRLQSATMRLPTLTADPGARQVVLWGTIDQWLPCNIGFPGPPYADKIIGALAQGFTIPNGLGVSSDPLTAHLEAHIRRGGFPGYLIISQSDVYFYAQEVPMRLILRYYRR